MCDFKLITEVIWISKFLNLFASKYCPSSSSIIYHDESLIILLGGKLFSYTSCVKFLFKTITIIFLPKTHQKIEYEGFMDTMFPNLIPTEVEWYYESISYSFDKNLEFSYYYPEFYTLKSDKEGKSFAPYYKAYNKDHCFSIRCNINEYWLIKAEELSFTRRRVRYPSTSRW